MSTAIELVRDGGELSVADVQAQIAKIQELMSKALKDGQHYGVIPGTGKKPTLLKPGAEKINLLFRIGTGDLEVIRNDMANGHREITIKTPMIHIPSGKVIAYGVGSCSTMESKYRYRNVADYEETGDPIPKDSKERKAEYRKQGYGMKKLGDGSWAWVKYTNTGKQENPDIADVYNTVLKMAAKRSYVDGTIKASAASDFFTQDVEDTLDHDFTEVAPHAGTNVPEDTSDVPPDMPLHPAAERMQLEKDIGEAARLAGADAVASARKEVETLRDMAKSGAIKPAEHIAKLMALKGTVEGIALEVV
jgi:hypothetical protein